MLAYCSFIRQPLTFYTELNSNILYRAFETAGKAKLFQRNTHALSINVKNVHSQHPK